MTWIMKPAMDEVMCWIPAVEGGEFQFLTNSMRCEK